MKPANVMLMKSGNDSISDISSGVNHLIMRTFVVLLIIDFLEKNPLCKITMYFTLLTFSIYWKTRNSEI